MHKWKIIVDSSSEALDLSKLERRVKPGVDLVFETHAYGYMMDDEFYYDDDLYADPDYDLDTIVTQIENAEKVSSAGSTSPGVIMEKMAQAENVIFFALTSRLSGGYSTAENGKKLLNLEYPDINAHVVDTKSISGEERLLAYKAIDLINEGLDFDQVVEGIKEYNESTYFLINQNSLNALVATGRIDIDHNQYVGSYHKRGLVHRSPDGMIRFYKTVRGTTPSVRCVINYLKDHGYEGGRLILTNSLNDRLFRITKEAILEEFPTADIEDSETLPTMAIYYGRGAVIVSFEGRHRQKA